MRVWHRIAIGCDPEGLALSTVPVVAAIAERGHADVLAIGVNTLGDTAGKEVNATVDELVASLRQLGAHPTSLICDAKPDRVATALVEAAGQFGADLIALGSHQRSDLRGLVLGSTVRGIAQVTETPLLVVGSHPARASMTSRGVPFPTRILIAIDASRQSEFAVTTAGLMARPGSEVRVFHVMPSPSLYDLFTWKTDVTRAQLLVQRAVDKLDQPGIHVTKEVVSGLGGVAEAIVARASMWRADVIVLGSRAHGRLGGFLVGSTAQAVIRQTSIPVVLGGRPKHGARAEWRGEADLN